MQIYKKLLLLSSSTIALFFSEMAINIACGPEADPYDNRQTYYLPNLEDNSFSAFQLIPYKFLYSEQEPVAESEINAQDWVKHLGNNVKKEDVISFMYNTDQATAELLKKSISSKILPDSIKTNTFVKSLLSSKHKHELEYFNFTKEQEPLTNIFQDPWNPDERNFDEILKYAQHAEESIGRYKKNSFLNLRYAYQAARLYLIAKDFPKSIAVYQKYFESNKQKSPIMNWALSNYAGAIRKNGDGAKAAYLFSKVFTQSPERRVLAYNNFHYITAEDSEIFALAKSREDQFNINAIIGFNKYDTSLKYLKNCYELDPANTVNAVLLAREVNKIEPYFINSSSLTYFDRNQDDHQDSIKVHLNTVRAFALKMFEDKKYVQPHLGLVTAAYLSWLNNENDLAKKYLNQADSKSMNSNLQDQYRITKMLTLLTDWKENKTLNEDELIATLKWLQKKAQADFKKNNPNEYYSAFENSSYSLITKNILENVVMNQYLVKGDTALASLAAVKADIFYNYGMSNDTLENNMQYETISFWQTHLSPKTLIKIEDYLRNPSKNSKMVQYLLEDVEKTNKTFLTELLGTAYLRELDFKNADKIFKTIPAGHRTPQYSNFYTDESISSNPFIVTINDYPKKYGKSGISKKEYAHRMLKLQELIKKTTDNNKKSDYYFQMASALYQTSTYGNSWPLVSYSWSAYDNHAKPTIYWERNYTQTKTAKEWYLKARMLSSNKDFKAKCTFMLAKCEQKDFSYDDESRWSYYTKAEDSPFYQFSMHNKYFKQLKTQYSNTAFYKIAARECTYLKDYIAGR